MPYWREKYPPRPQYFRWISDDALGVLILIGLGLAFYGVLYLLFIEKWAFLWLRWFT